MLAAFLQSSLSLPNMAHFKERLATFSNWPLDEPSSREMAACGFVCTDDHRTVCFFCKQEVGPWEKGDNPWVRHHKACRCPFICKNPMYPHMKRYETRLKSFKDWPALEKEYPAPRLLAIHGYFYSNTFKVTCYFCGTYFRDFDGDDDLCVYHAYPRCPKKLENGYRTDYLYHSHDLRPQKLNGPVYVVAPDPPGNTDSIGPKHPEMSDHDDRLESLSKFMQVSPVTDTLAQWGFCYPSRHHVTCFFCGVRLNYHWTQLDDLSVEHVERSGRRCPLALQNERPPGYFQIMKHPIMADLDARLETFYNWQDPMGFPDLKFEDLAKCGFFTYGNYEPNIACFYCGRFLFLFGEELDRCPWRGDPWEVHIEIAKGRCPFVLQNRNPLVKEEA